MPSCAPRTLIAFGSLAVLLLTLGLRKGEALALRWEQMDIDAPEPSLSIESTLSRVASKGLVLGPTKTNGSAGTIPLVEPALSALRKHRKQQSTERLAANVWIDPGIVFCNTHRHLDRPTKRATHMAPMDRDRGAGEAPDARITPHLRHLDAEQRCSARSGVSCPQTRLHPHDRRCLRPGGGRREAEGARSTGRRIVNLSSRPRVTSP